jgi:hypothetical protein
MKYIVFTFLLFLANQIIFAQEEKPEKHTSTKKIDEKCYTSCRKPDFYKDTVQTYFIFTGDRTKEIVDLDEIVTKIIPAEQGWVKKKADINCRSSNPDDCLVWCFVTTPETIESMLFVKDTSQTKNYYPKILPFRKKITDQNIYTQEVICAEKLDKALVKKIQKRLKKLDFLKQKANGVIDENLRNALMDYQVNNNLFIGGFTIESIQALEIEF